MYEYRRKKLNDTKDKGFNVKITNFLLNEYEKNKYLDVQSIERIALKVSLTAKQASYWFSNRRNKI